MEDCEVDGPGVALNEVVCKRAGWHVLKLPAVPIIDFASESMEIETRSKGEDITSSGVVIMS
jgi:hypothetical protein